jgi:hypothetical protein
MKSLIIQGRRSIIKIFIISFLLVSCIFPQSSTFSGTGNWNDAGRWSAGIPTSTTNAIIAAGSNCTVNIDNAICSTLTFNSGAASNLQISNWRNQLTVSSDITVYDTVTISPGFLSRLIAGGTLVVNGSLTLNPGFWGIVEFRNGITNYGTFSASGSGIYYFNTNNQSLNGNPITLSGTYGTTTIQGAISVTNNTILTVLGNLNGDAGNSKFINASDATLNVTGSLMSTGKLDASSPNNIVNYNGTAQTIKDTVYFHLFTEGSGTKTVPSSSSALNIHGNLSIDGGITVNGNNRIIYIEGDLLNNGTFINVNFISFDGTTAQIIGGAATFGTVEINNVSGVTILGSLKITDLLILINGKINTSAANSLTIGDTATISGGNNSSFINGPLVRIKSTIGEQSLTFPIGKGSNYRPIELTLNHSNITPSNYTAEVFNSAPTGRTLPGSLDKVSTVRYWNVTKTGAAALTSAYITLNYGIDDGVTSPGELRIAKSNGSAWEDIGGTGNGTPEGSILSSQFTSFSDFVLANADGGINPLPVELASFTATSMGSEVILKWTTKTEMQNYGFEIERCRKSEQNSEYKWENIGFVKGSGNSNSPKEYYFNDQKISAGIYLFRLKQVDTDGSFQYSGEVEVSIANITDSYVLEQNYPNPFNPSTIIKFAVNETSPVSIKVYDALGKEVVTLFNETAESGKYYSIEFNGSDYSSGVYYYAIAGNNYNAVKKMILIK